MCVIAIKYFDDIGWIGAKNRDRNYLPTINIIQSNRKGTQRLYIDDELTRYTEGLNEYGLCILSSALSVKDDEKEGDKINPRKLRGNRPDGYMSPDGKTIRDALLEKNPINAVELIVDRELAGATVVFNQKECYIIEGGFNIRKDDADKDNPRKYVHQVKKIEAKDGTFLVRANHGIYIPELGYQNDSENSDKQKSRDSSESRYAIASVGVKQCTDPMEMMNAISNSPKKDKFMNPVRLGNVEKGDMVTTGQLMLSPKDRTMHYRPIYSQINVRYNKINNPEAKTFFEIVSSKKLLGFREWVQS